MHISHLHIHNFRNIGELKIELSPHCNLFYGENGSGKTSILEALYYLSTARSFRSHLATRVVQYGYDKFTLFTIAIDENGGAQTTLGVERPLQGLTTLQLQGETVSTAAIAKFLPMQLLHQNSFELLALGPKYKRKFIDWGMFHVEHDFLMAWKNARRALEQRNAALATPASSAAAAASAASWDQELAKWGTELHVWREQYVAELRPVIDELLQQLLGNYKISIEYYAGWETAENLYDVLRNNFGRDQMLRRTQFGPHRADLRLLVNNIPIQDCLSRGQQKIFIFIMHLAQGLLLRKTTGATCIYLIDDLAAELDRERQKMVATILRDIDAQVFITALEQEGLQDFVGEEQTNTFAHSAKMFHVEHGAMAKGALEGTQ